MTKTWALVVLAWLVPFAERGASAAPASSEVVFVRGFAGEAEGGFRQAWHTHLGFMPLSGVRQTKPDLEMKWKSAPLPKELSARQVTFTWIGATGLNEGGWDGFTVWVNGRAAADFDVVNQPTRFQPRVKGCDFRYDAVWTYNNGVDSSGQFYLTVPAGWLTAGQPAVIAVKARDTGSRAWFALAQSEETPSSMPDRAWVAPPGPALPPPPGQEASYEWYLPQYPDPINWTPIGPPADPAETCVSRTGQLISCPRDGYFRPLRGTQYFKNGLAFALYAEGKIVPFGAETGAHQSIADGNKPIVTTTWQRGGLEIRELAYAEPLRGDAYQTGLESTLAWAAIEISNQGQAPEQVTCLAALLGDDKNPQREVQFKDGVLFQNGSACVAVPTLPAGFKLEFHPVFPAAAKQGSDPLAILREHRGLYNALVLTGTIEPGRTARMVLNRVFDFPGADHWEGKPPVVAPEELTGRSFEAGLAARTEQCNRLARQVACFQTPEPILNQIVTKAMLDGYFLTKRWNGKYICFDSVVYRCQWDDASTKWFYALDLMGDHRTAERLLDTVFERQGQRKPAGTRTHEGCFSDVTNIDRDGSSASWASCNGWALWAMAEHARLTNARAWLERHRRQILAGCRWILRERQFSKEPAGNPCAGLLYGKFVCDMPDSEQGGPSGVGYFAYTDAISYMGLHEMARLLADWGHPEGTGLLDEAEAYRRDIVAAMDRLTDKSQDPWYVPWILHAPGYINRYLYDACGPVNLAFTCGSGGVLPCRDERIRQVIRWIMDRTHRGSLEHTAAGIPRPMLSNGSAFYTQDLALVLLEQERVEEFLRIFYTLTAAGITHETLTTTEWGPNTMPHIHSISSLVRMFRSMMVQERDGRLYLLQGTPRAWLQDGKRIAIEQAPTWYGPISLQCVSKVAAGAIRVRLDVPERIGATPVYLKLRLPVGMRLGDIEVNGRKHLQRDGEWIILRGETGRLEIVGSVNST